MWAFSSPKEQHKGVFLPGCFIQRNPGLHSKVRLSIQLLYQSLPNPLDVDSSGHDGAHYLLLITLTATSLLLSVIFRHTFSLTTQTQNLSLACVCTTWVISVRSSALTAHRQMCTQSGCDVLSSWKWRG